MTNISQAFPKFKKQQICNVFTIPEVVRESSKEVKDEGDYLHADENQSFLQVGFNNLGIKVS